MMSLSFSKDSWHYKVAKFGTLRTYDSETDMCHYVRSFIWGVIKGAVIGAVLGGLALLLLMGEGAFIGSLIAAFVTGVWVFEGFALFGAFINIVVLLIAGMIGVAYSIDKYRESHPKKKTPSKPDGFIKNAYHGWKDKYCAKVKIERSAAEKIEDAERDAYYAEWRAQQEAEKARNAAMEPVLDEIIKDLDKPDESQPKS